MDWETLSFFCLFPATGPGGEMVTAKQEREKSGDMYEKESFVSVMGSHAFAAIMLKIDILGVHEVVDLNPKYNTKVKCFKQIRHN